MKKLIIKCQCYDKKVYQIKFLFRRCIIFDGNIFRFMEIILKIKLFNIFI